LHEHAVMRSSFSKGLVKDARSSFPYDDESFLDEELRELGRILYLIQSCDLHQSDALATPYW
jgi:hypothetical protein